MPRNPFILTFLLVCGIALTPAHGQAYKFADLPGPSMTPFAINDGGDTAGQFCCAATNDIYDFPEMSYVSTSFSGFNVILPSQGLHINNFAAGLNNGDTVVGGYSDNSSVTHGFRFDAGVGTFKTLNYPGALSTAALGINDSSQIVGVFCTKKDACSSTVSSGDHCFSLVNGTYYTDRLSGRHRDGVQCGEQQRRHCRYLPKCDSIQRVPVLERSIHHHRSRTLALFRRTGD